METHMMTIGLPRAMLYYRCRALWHTFFEELGADSVDLVELSMNLEEEFGIEEMGEEDIASIHNVGDLVNYLSKKLGE